ncbi:MAG TPA: zinc-binding dehydrogenase [Chloroflexota bacterium]|jgi:D-arabinose 1-dehydrogenase-like Zn-dependent alcohol dehydrogenase|nr:zinc-binding dehydrogenase [Chloroflexota bacterium]
MAETGRAAVFYEAGRPFEVKELPLPEVEPDAALVRITCANICGSDLHTWRGEYRASGASPSGFVTGHEGTGRIARLGGNVTTDSLGRPLKEGDRVVFTYFFPCRRCSVCLDDMPNACPTRFTRFGPRAADVPPYFTGTYAEFYYLRPGHYVFRVPDELSDEVVAPANCALSQVIHGIQQGGLRFGDAIVLQGAGGLGLNAAAVAKEMGAGPVITIDRLPARLEMARRFGADVVVDASELAAPEERIARVKELTGGVGARVVMDLVGSPRVIPEGLEMLRPGGTYVEIGCIHPSPVELDASKLVWGNRRLVAMTHYHPWALPRALDFLVRTKGTYPFDRLLSHSFPLERINEAFQTAEWAGKSDPSAVVRACITP